MTYAICTYPDAGGENQIWPGKGEEPTLEEATAEYERILQRYQRGTFDLVGRLVLYEFDDGLPEPIESKYFISVL